MRTPGQTWSFAAASFLGMWVVMMAAMMLPSLIPMLWRYRQAVGSPGGTRLGRLTVLVGVAYFCVWAAFGLAAFPLGVALAAICGHRHTDSRVCAGQARQRAPRPCGRRRACADPDDRHGLRRFAR